MDEARDYLAALRSYLPPDIRRLPEERQLEYLSELLSHHHRHHRYKSTVIVARRSLIVQVAWLDPRTWK